MLTKFYQVLWSTTTNAPLSSGKITFINSNTALAVNAYSDYTGSTSVGSTVDADSYGRIEVYLYPGLYDIQIKDSTGSLINTIERYLVIDSEYSAATAVGINLAKVATPGSDKTIKVESDSDVILVDDITTVNGQTGPTIVLDADDIDDTSTAHKFTTAAEISKLAGIESGATADQTGSEIKSLYEAQANTNAYTDAEKTKLAGIETGATADQSAGEIKTLYESNANTNAFTDADEAKLDAIEAGAQVNTVDSVNGLTGVVVLDPDDLDDTLTTNKFTTAAEISKLAGIESGATADQTAGEIKTLYESNANTNAFTDADESKLDGIEANATADQTGAEIKALYEAELDTNAYTDAEKSKLAGIEAGAQVNTVDSVNGLTGVVVLTKTNIGLGNVDNTSDLNKPISTATQFALDGKAPISHTHTSTQITGNTDATRVWYGNNIVFNDNHGSTAIYGLNMTFNGEINFSTVIGEDITTNNDSLYSVIIGNDITLGNTVSLGSSVSNWLIGDTITLVDPLDNDNIAIGTTIEVDGSKNMTLCTNSLDVVGTNNIALSTVVNGYWGTGHSGNYNFVVNSTRVTGNNNISFMSRGLTVPIYELDGNDNIAMMSHDITGNDNIILKCNRAVTCNDTVIIGDLPSSISVQSNTVYLTSSGPESTDSVLQLTAQGEVSIVNASQPGYVMPTKTTTERNAYSGSQPTGTTLIDTTLNKVIWWDGSNWRDAMGSIV